MQCPHCYKYLTVPIIKGGSGPSSKLESMDIDDVVVSEPTRDALQPPPPPPILESVPGEYDLLPGPEEDYDVIRIDLTSLPAETGGRPSIGQMVRAPLFWALVVLILVIGFGGGMFLAPLLKGTPK